MKSWQRASSRLLLVVLLSLALPSPSASAGELTSKRASIVLHAELPSYAGAKMSPLDRVGLEDFHFEVGRMPGTKVRISIGLAKYGSQTLLPIALPVGSDLTQIKAVIPAEVLSEKTVASGELLTIQLEAF